jgi:hypothetical protein
MGSILENLIKFVGLLFGHSDLLFASAADFAKNLAVTSALVATAFAGATILTDTSSELQAVAIDERFANIDNPVGTVERFFHGPLSTLN